MKNYLLPLPPEQTILIEGTLITLYIVEDGMWLLTDEHIAKAYDIRRTTVRSHFGRNKDILIEGSHWFMKKGDLPRNNPRLRLWTREGLIKLGDFVKTSKSELLLTALGVKSRQKTKVESEYLSIISAAFDDILPFQYQYEVAGYKVDMYFPTIRIALEIDEHDHSTYNRSNETIRELIVKKNLKCDFIRFNPNSPSNNIGKLINVILRHATRKILMP